MERRGHQWREPRTDYQSEDSGDEQRRRYQLTFANRHQSERMKSRNNSDAGGSTLLKMDTSCPFS
jgi:hypothetical protein